MIFICPANEGDPSAFSFLWPAPSSCQVTWGHGVLLANKFYRKRYRRVCDLLVFSSSKHIQWYAIWPILTKPELETTWPQFTWPLVKLWPWPLGGKKKYIFWCVSTRGARWRLNFCSSSIRLKVIMTLTEKKVFSSFLSPYCRLNFRFSKLSSMSHVLTCPRAK